MSYDRKSPRLKNWNYGSNGLYFITINTKNRVHSFGEIQNNQMVYSAVGAIANVLWFELQHRNKYVSLGEFAIMPNHLHGIIQLENPNNKPLERNSHIADKNETISEKMSAISPKANSISTIIRSYKSAVTKHCNRLNLEFMWQSRYHDHIIRDEKSFLTISQYIINNPKKWNEDESNL
tara:strand:+ start:3712 stop:4248 length:537 start_codon:yes stop_codon:yes gene_type:complete